MISPAAAFTLCSRPLLKPIALWRTMGGARSGSGGVRPLDDWVRSPASRNQDPVRVSAARTQCSAPPRTQNMIYVRCEYHVPVIALLAVLITIVAGRAAGEDNRYVPAACNDLEVTVYPPSATATKLSLPHGLRCQKFNNDGRGLLASDASSGHGPYQSGVRDVKFNPSRVARIPNSEKLNDFVVTSLDVSAAKGSLVVSGQRRKGDACGIFEIRIADGAVLPILEVSNCEQKVSEQELWSGLSLSPNGREAVASRGSISRGDLRLELIDLVTATAKPLAEGFWNPAWSPDGRWIAAVKGGPDRGYIYLIDPAGRAQPRRLSGRTTLKPVWSPDSQFLLMSSHSLLCGISVDVDPPETLRVLDISRDKVSTITGSRCLINGGPVGWFEYRSAGAGKD